MEDDYNGSFSDFTRTIYSEMYEFGKVRLALIVGPEDGSVDFMDRAEAIGLGISYDMLLDALSEAEVATSMNGRYPINDAIRQRLRKLLKC